MTDFFEPAARLGLIPPYLFKTIDDKKAEVKARGVDIIDLGVGDPDLPTPRFIVEKMIEVVQDPGNPPLPGLLRHEPLPGGGGPLVSGAFRGGPGPGERSPHPHRLQGGHRPPAPGDQRPRGHQPDDHAGLPGLPDGHPVRRRLLPFSAPDPGEPLSCRICTHIPPLVARDAKAFFFNYPNNPTAAVADKDFFAKVVDFCREHEIIAVHDAAYTELAYDGYQPPSFLEVPGAKEIGIEFHSLSKTYNMTGWRLGMAVGNAEVLAALGKIKSNIDSGAFDAIQLAGIAALDSDQSCVRENCAILQERRDILVGGLQEIGL